MEPKLKVGDIACIEYPGYDTEGNIIRTFPLEGEVVYSNEAVFIVQDNGRTDEEILFEGGLSYNTCKKYLPGFEISTKTSALNEFVMVEHSSESFFHKDDIEHMGFLD